MPVIKSAIKKARQDERTRKHNRVIRDNYKEAAKNFRKAVISGDSKKTIEALNVAYSKIDKAAKKNIIHKNNANRRKARLALLIKSEKTVKTTKSK